jgi:hypothetical protein
MDGQEREHVLETEAFGVAHERRHKDRSRRSTDFNVDHGLRAAAGRAPARFARAHPHIAITMDTPIELERETTADAPRSPIEEASFVVLESGRVRFCICPRLEACAPRSIDDVQSSSFTLAPRSHDRVRRLSLLSRRLPDSHLHDKQWVFVERVVTVSKDARARQRVEQSGAIEVAYGTYAIASHRDHVHLLYELDLGSVAVPPRLLQELRLVRRASYVAAIPRVAALRWVGDARTSNARALDPKRWLPLDLSLLEEEGTEFVLFSGSHLHVHPAPGWSRW